MIELITEPNILFIMCDTLRKDVSQVYGGEARTPFLQKLAKDSMVYQNAIAPSPWTLPSHISLFTGLYVGQHGVHEKGKEFDPLAVMKDSKRLSSEKFPEWLSRRGYASTGISNNPWVSDHTGFQAGFDSFVNIASQPQWILGAISNASEIGSSKLEILFKLVSKRKFKELANYGNAWGNKMLYDTLHNFPFDKGVKATAKRLEDEDWKNKFFKFINLVEVHEPYRNESDIERWGATLGFKKQNTKRATELKHEYVSEVEYLDSKLGRIIKLLKDKRLYDNTAIIITSDHGQAFNEHGYMYHGIYVHEEIARIPLIIKYPKSKKFNIQKGYQSLKNLNTLIKSIADGGNDECLTTGTAFTESYGLCHVAPARYRRRKVDSNYTKARIAVYNEDYKMTYNITEDTAEELLWRGKPLEVDSNRERVADMLEEWRCMITAKHATKIRK